MTRNLPHQLQRTIRIQAGVDTVFRYFTDSGRWASWWGEGSTIDPRPGGAVLIRYPGGVEAAGEVVEIEPPNRLVFTYGFVQGTPIPVGASVVTIQVAREGEASRVDLAHQFAEASARDEHVQGWRYQLSRFANVVSDENYATASEIVDAWFAAWSEPDAALRDATLTRIATSDVTFQDTYSHVAGLQDLLPHLAAVHRFMPGMIVTRQSGIRHCQGVVLADWIARAAAGDERGRGTNVFTFATEGRLAAVTGFWSR